MKKFEMLNLICKDCELTAKEKLVAQYFVYKSNSTGACYPCVATIAEECGVSRRTVQRATKKLCEIGYIIIEKRFKFGRQESNLYSFNTLLLSEIQHEKEVEQDKVDSISIQEEMEIIEFEELLQRKEADNECDVFSEEGYQDAEEEIDLDILVASSDDEDFVWEEAYDAPEEQEIEETENVQGEQEQQRMFSFSVTMQVISFICTLAEIWITEQIVVYIVFRYDLVNVNSGFLVYQENGASIKIMGAFFPP